MWGIKKEEFIDPLGKRTPEEIALEELEDRYVFGKDFYTSREWSRYLMEKARLVKKVEQIKMNLSEIGV